MNTVGVERRELHYTLLNGVSQVFIPQGSMSKSDLFKIFEITHPKETYKFESLRLVTYETVE